MPKTEETKRGGAVRYRTIRVGTGRHKKVLHIAIVRKAGPRGGHTVSARTHTPKK